MHWLYRKEKKPLIKKYGKFNEIWRRVAIGLTVDF